MMVSGRAGIYRLIACWWLGFMLIFVVNVSALNLHEMLQGSTQPI